MKHLTDREIQIINSMISLYFEIVPAEFRTYCALTSRISKSVLEHFKIESKLVPCQVWYATPNGKYTFGFLGNPKLKSKWDGHVVCSVEGFIIDTALHHFTSEFGLNCPATIIASTFDIPTQVIGMHELNETVQLWWFHPPKGFDLAPPKQPTELISSLAKQLIEAIKEQLTYSTDEPPARTGT